MIDNPDFKVNIEKKTVDKAIHKNGDLTYHLKEYKAMNTDQKRGEKQTTLVNKISSERAFSRLTEKSKSTPLIS
ncbi:hypothetical protein SAMN05444278_106154 [Psychroflexus salarius]|uniref:Uncharacterized protein n=1 Tax=Psychroflexus salarius TaxID=1155689 RepID=A0A1M4WT25_9FLAO|nr:hypothetical protein [Psychroflexus salarius]SHE84379.1 hypothetical protein SAMN05444278_106154 [Psychroflexus salarius]